MQTSLKSCRRNPATWALGSLLMLLSLNAESAEIRVTDEAGALLENAVVEVYFESSPVTTVQTKHIVQRNAVFHPQVLAISTDSHVAFPNEDTTRHHVFSFSPAKVFDLELYLSETPPPIHFDQAGVVVLGCNIHDSMQAFIVVSDAPYAALTDVRGTLTLPTLPEGRHKMRVWHSRMHDSQEVWWEGDISNADNMTVSLELNAIPPQPSSISPLQQRFHDATNKH
ncbi:Cupredoxin [Vreelandella andesensis]|uniref:Cupredoxin n=1 Tax=Vreelandella andesensis TaxID=447567 RepID=A0A3S1DL03_9GAMM|nr:Cupredoxin [Halomonas andesensis]RUR28925.1 Cupredoxin [Halomonas andesensis]